MTRHANQNKGIAATSRVTLSPFERPIRQSGYELRNAAGAVLQAHNDLGALRRYFEDKTGCVIVRCSDQKIVWPEPSDSPIDSST